MGRWRIGRRLAGLALAAAVALAAGDGLAFTVEQLESAGVTAAGAEQVEKAHRSAFTYVDPAVAGIEGVLSWETFAALDYTYESPFPGATTFTRSFGAAIEALDGEEIRLAGFIYPLEAGERHARFLFSGFPPGCPFCLPAGPEQLVEVLTAEPVRFTDKPVILAGRFELLHDDPSGLYYRLHEARAIEP
jgi:uncharacterized protein